MHQAPREAPRERVFIRGLAGRVALLVLFSSLAIAGIAVGAAVDLRGAIVADAEASASRLTAVARLVEQGFVVDAERMLGSVGALRGNSGCDAALAAVLARDPRFLAAGIADPDGDVLCAAPSVPGGVAERTYVRRALSQKAFAMGDYAVDDVADRPTLGFAMPIMDDGQVVAVTFAVMDVRGIGDGGLRAALPPESAFGVVDGRAVMILRHPEPDRWAGQPLPESGLAAEMLSRKEGVARIEGFDGVSRLYAFSRLHGLASPGAYVYVGVPSSVAYAGVQAAAFRAMIVAAFLAAIALWAAFTLGDILILRRIRKMVGTMRHIVLGELDERGDLPRGLGELDELTNIFDLITVRLKEAYSRTEEKVKTRTVELEFNKGMAELEKARIEALLASIGEGVVATDKDGKIMFTNDEAAKATGWTVEEIVGKPEASVFAFQDDKGEPMPSDERPAHVAFTTGKKQFLGLHPKPHFLVRKDKSTFPVQVTVSPVNFEGNTIGTIEVIRDVTDEAEFDRRKSEFISIASHQLRSPLSATKWLSDMLRKGDLGPLQPKQQEIADKLFEANERMVVLVNELLNVSRLDSGVTKLTPQPTDMAKLLDGIMTDTMALLSAKKQTFVYDKRALPTVMVDSLHIREVITNIISNASKYSPEGGRVTIVAEKRGSDFYLAVKDDGIGIPKSDQNQMFKKFFRAENALKSAVQGTGLGLYFCKSIVELSGGKIWFESEVNKGTTFIITLPIEGVAQPDAGKA